MGKFNFLTPSNEPKKPLKNLPVEENTVIKTTEEIEPITIASIPSESLLVAPKKTLRRNIFAKIFGNRVNSNEEDQNAEITVRTNDEVTESTNVLMPKEDEERKRPVVLHSEFVEVTERTLVTKPSNVGKRKRPVVPFQKAREIY